MTLIEQLEAAEKGSRELDAEIAVVIWPRLASMAPDTERGPGHWYDPDVGPTYAENYTTSLDAGLPDENIIYMAFNFGACLWEAHQYNEGGFPFVGWAHTEALARRIAALKAMKETQDG